jgi:hypothetical protein
VSKWIAERAKDGVLPQEFGVFVRSGAQLDRARAAVKEAGMAFKILDEHVETTSGHVSISTMHLAKGLEFRAVVVMACDDEIIPLQERIETVGDDADLHEVYETERHLLYVACTRARDHLMVTGIDPVSEFLDDIMNGAPLTLLGGSGGSRVRTQIDARPRNATERAFFPVSGAARIRGPVPATTVARST